MGKWKLNLPIDGGESWRLDFIEVLRLLQAFSLGFASGIVWYECVMDGIDRALTLSLSFSSF